ncbi:EAL domain-containing protein [Lichenihabitans sp. Uapishka_5]|uniref:putative bifunctional diguanylate cyclase/phosphodiesterase n=1 Tax=Lichenihabitans sp. Uapishka_5 TaxID=3037302 RepID=UPI0029E822E5|nr:EAL domain-containing protein [Lichenihabitans sp. Uapishka_5]MDX7952934.1 EAL domain-containing protein [Lichenihabitans sp. Uapishka_5]
MPVTALGFDRLAICRFATDRARALFPGREPVGLSATILFADWTTPPAFDRNGIATLRRRADQFLRCDTTRHPDGTWDCVLTDTGQDNGPIVAPPVDDLTGLILRGALRDKLAGVLADARARQTGVAVHAIDLDRFKQINDTLGHAVGDLLLVKVAERLRSTLEPGDHAARLGGDEFLVVQAGVSDRAEAEARAARLTDLIGRTYVVQGHMLNVGASVGVALCPDDATDAVSLLRHADLALYRAKADGRGIARFFEPGMNARMQARQQLEADLRLALARRQFSLAFQPQYCLDAGSVSGFEALLRWTHPERGPISPADFIPLAEEIGLIVGIGEWVLRTACREAVGWPIPASIAVNVSPVQFKTGKLAETVFSVLAQTGLAPGRLELEITEGALLDETNLVLKTLHAVRDIGVRVSMDDFGTGYSSLSYLRRFPFDKIKIDQSFVRGLGDGRDCEAIVRAVASLGASLGMRTTAEGVETPEQLARVRAEGCTEVQGYLTGRPLTAADATTLLLAETGKAKTHA